jgi:hypothetical protein
MSHVVDSSTGSFAGFPSELFRLEGDPSAIRGSASEWTEFGAEASAASEQIRSLDTSLFIGPEGEQYREGLSQDLAPHLQRTGDAYNQVGRALCTFADGLSALQDEMRPLTVRAPHLWDDLQAARANLTYAQDADRTHDQAVLADPGAPPDAYQSHTGSASLTLSAAQQAWDACVNEAAQIMAAHDEFVQDCCRIIDDAKDQAFAKNPHGLGVVTSGFKTFVKDHVAGLTKISSALKLVSGIASVLAFVPALNVIAAPVAVATGAAALAIDASIKGVTGQGSWKSIGFDAALMVIPGVGKLASRAAESSAALAVGLSEATQEARASSHLVQEASSIADSEVAAGTAANEGIGRGNPEFFGGRETYARREYDPDQAGGEVRHLDASLATVHHAGVDAVEAHLNRFVPDRKLGSDEQKMLDRLRAVASGNLKPTTWDLNFYTHELTESERYAALGHTSGYLGSDDMYDVWNHVHTATLRDYGVKPEDLYHPEARK